MKKALFLAVATLGLLALGGLTSCQDEDFGVSTTVLKERAFEQGFIKEFGKPSADQNWDFYSQYMQSLRRRADMTRATAAATVTPTPIAQPTDAYFKEIANSWEYSLEEGLNNSQNGQNNYKLTSTGTFKIYAVNYGGGIETDWNEQRSYEFDFGLIYIDPDDKTERRVHLFDPGYKDGYSPTYSSWDSNPNNSEHWDCGNPGWGQEVTLPVGTEFYFYLSYEWYYGSNNHPVQTFYSNQSPEFIRKNGNRRSFEEYEGRYYFGTSTLINTTEHIDETTGKDEQYIMIGFEDAWGLDGNSDDGVQDWMDLDFNDVVVLIVGDLPVAENKRFFCEDKSNADWDYNDVVFDVSNTGITLRAVGGTLPVWLKVTDKNNDVTYTDELHELMRSLQPQAIHQNEELTYDVDVIVDGEKVTKTFYKPIDVGAYPGLWLDPVQIIVWRYSVDPNKPSTRLDEGDLAYFANPLAGEDKVGDVALIVGSKYGQTMAQALAQAEQPNEEGIWENGVEKQATIVKFPNSGEIPAIWSSTVNVRWMKELQKITLGYHNFYAGGEDTDETGFPLWWKSGLDDSYWYQFQGDGENPDGN